MPVAPAVASAQLGERRRSRPRGRHDRRNRGKGIARPEQAREPKQSWRAQSPHAWMSAIATARQVCWAADSEQAQSRVAWAPAVPSDRCDLDYTVVALPGVAVISSLPRISAAPFRRGSFTNQRHWCQATTAWRAPGNGRVRRAPEGLRRIRATDLSRRGPMLLALDHKQFPVRHLCETASVLSGSGPIACKSPCRASNRRRDGSPARPPLAARPAAG